MKAEPQSETSMVSSKVAKLDLLVSDVERASRRRASFPILTVVLVVLAACGGSLVTWWIAGNSGPPVTAPPDSIAKPAPTPAIVADAPVELTGYFVAPDSVNLETLVARAGGGEAGFVGTALSVLLVLNVFLAAFNLLPLPPLDGGAVVEIVLPESWIGQIRQLQANGMLSMMGLLVAWRLFPMMTGPLFNLVLRAVHPAFAYD